MNVYPNPATDAIRLDYILPDNIKSAKLYVVALNGRTVKNFLIDSHTDHMAMDVKAISSGVYFYFMEYDNIRTISRKIVVQ